MTWFSPDWPVTDKVAATMKADSVLAPKLQGNKVYTGTGEKGRPIPHVALSTADIRNRHQFAKKGNQNTFTWIVIGTDKKQCADIVNDLYRLFNGPKLALTDHVMVQGSLEQIFADDGPDLEDYQIVLEYTVHSVRSAA